MLHTTVQHPLHVDFVLFVVCVLIVVCIAHIFLPSVHTHYMLSTVWVIITAYHMQSLY
jgi:hypothetical protein